MSPGPADFSPTVLLAAASQALASGGYRLIDQGFPAWNTPTSRLFEDAYNVVGVVVFETCHELLSGWPDLQGSLVDLMSQHIGHEESKAWDGHLVLLSPALAPSEEAEIDSVRYNTARLRKLVATGEELRVPSDVERVVQPLLPLGSERAGVSEGSALDLLPGLLAKQGINTETTTLLVRAFREQAPLLEQLHKGGAAT